MDLKICPDGTPAPVPADSCCPSLTACKTSGKCSLSNKQDPSNLIYF